MRCDLDALRRVEEASMLLVPRQLLRAGMTGNVPYYGGRFSPAQAYAASHPSGPPRPAPASPPVRPEPPARSRPETLVALQHLLDDGVITQAEFGELRARIIA
jgi:hypothetical protein